MCVCWCAHTVVYITSSHKTPCVLISSFLCSQTNQDGCSPALLLHPLPDQCLLQLNAKNWKDSHYTKATKFKFCGLLSEVVQSCPTLCDPMDCSPPGSSVHGILQARILEWVAISFSRGSSQPRDRTQVSHTAGRFFTS